MSMYLWPVQQQYSSKCVPVGSTAASVCLWPALVGLSEVVGTRRIRCGPKCWPAAASSPPPAAASSSYLLWHRGARGRLHFMACDCREVPVAVALQYAHACKQTNVCVTHAAHAARRMQRGACSEAHAARRMHQAACIKQHAISSMQRAACIKQDSLGWAPSLVIICASTIFKCRCQVMLWWMYVSVLQHAHQSSQELQYSNRHAGLAPGLGR
eukprot:355404-Chlamydomonas_euryale.AAC.4